MFTDSDLSFKVLIIVVIVILVVLLLKLISSGSHSEGYDGPKSKGRAPSKVRNVHIVKLGQADPAAVAAAGGSTNGIPGLGAYYFTWNGPQSGFEPELGYRGSYTIVVMQGKTTLYTLTNVSPDVTLAPIPTPSVGAYTINITPANHYGKGKMVSFTGSVTPSMAIASITPTIGAESLQMSITVDCNYSTGVDTTQYFVQLTGTTPNGTLTYWDKSPSGGSTGMGTAPMINAPMTAGTPASGAVTYTLKGWLSFYLYAGKGQFYRNDTVTVRADLWKKSSSGPGKIVDSMSIPWIITGDKSPGDLATSPVFNDNSSTASAGQSGITNMVTINPAIKTRCNMPMTNPATKSNSFDSAYDCQQQIYAQLDNKQPMDFPCGKAYPQAFTWDSTDKTCTAYSAYIGSNDLTVAATSQPAGTTWLGYTPGQPSS